mmetsp:Transcript_50763/g.147844  ORF Transcript_50763/g.147844 Transcript_50763/m.147844 type:complete len:282 (+) Transcript_50763:460-1305(+)
MFRPLKSRTRLSTSSFHVGCLVKSVWTSPASSSCGPARSPRPSIGHQTTRLPSEYRLGIWTSMQLKMPSPMGSLECRMVATCCFPREEHERCWGNDRQCSQRSWTSLHSLLSLLKLMVNAGREGSYNLPSSEGSYKNRSTRQASRCARAYIRKSPPSENSLYCILSSERTTWKRQSLLDRRSGCMNSVAISRARPHSKLSAMSKALSRSHLSKSSSRSRGDAAVEAVLLEEEKVLQTMSLGHSHDIGPSSWVAIMCGGMHSRGPENRENLLTSFALEAKMA